jgi:hypothetical protein
MAQILPNAFSFNQLLRIFYVYYYSMLSTFKFFKIPENLSINLKHPNSKIKTFEKKSGDLKYFQKNFSSSDTHKNIFKQLCFILVVFKTLFLSNYKTSKMFQNLKSGDLLNFPQKSLGSDFSSLKNVSCVFKILLFFIQISKVSKNFKNGKTGDFWYFSRFLLWP